MNGGREVVLKRRGEDSVIVKRRSVVVVRGPEASSGLSLRRIGTKKMFVSF